MNLPQKWFQEYAVLSSPAKVNLRLKVTGRRGDGYHLLSMINCSCSLADTVRIRLTDEGAVSVAMNFSAALRAPLVMPPAEHNLALRAVKEFCAEFGFGFGAQIEIDKRIPLGSGLGGGSGNAATILAFLSKICRAELPNDFSGRIARVALSLGADVPFMVDGGVARVGGVGEEVTPLRAPELDGYPIGLIFPEFGIDTASIFDQLRRRPHSSFVPDSLGDSIVHSGQDIPTSSVFSLIDNDLFEVARDIQPELQRITTTLQGSGSLICSMSGSGSTLFVLPRIQQGPAHLEDQLSQLLRGYPVSILVAKLDIKRSGNAIS